MVGFVLLLAIANLGLGYLAAATLIEPPLWSGLKLRFRSHAPAAVNVHKDSAPSPNTTTKALAPLPSLAEVGQGGRPAIAGLDELPAGWLVQLSNQGIVAHTYVEATSHILRLDVNRYREQLVVAETRTRNTTGQQDAVALSKLADELRAVNQDWLDKQSSAADMLGQRSGCLGDHEQAATTLEQALLDQAAQISAACEQLSSLNAVPELENRRRQLLELIATLLLHAHALRDRITDLLATLMRAGTTMEILPSVVKNDATTELPNRIGLESILAGWWAEDTQRTRLLSAVLVDVDRFGRINQRLGTYAGDLALTAIGKLIDETVVKDQGFEKLTRVGGDKFLLLQGDVGPHQALTAAERLRQAIEATTFENQGVEFDLTISCGVIEVGHAESSLELVRRAFEAMRFAKKAGRNRCALDKGNGPSMLDPPQFPVKARLVPLVG
jgi:diguanylate cyclase